MYVTAGQWSLADNTMCLVVRGREDVHQPGAGGAAGGLVGG